MTCYNRVPSFIENCCHLVSRYSAFFLTEQHKSFQVPGEEVMPAEVALLLAENLAKNEIDPDEKIWPIIWDLDRTFIVPFIQSLCHQRTFIFSFLILERSLVTKQYVE